MAADPTMGGELNVVGGRNCSGDGKPLDDVADGHGHGTHVAGTIGARDDDIGVVGVAPGSGCGPCACSTASGRGNVSGLICAIDWIAAWVDAHPGRRMAVNLSLGGLDPYRAPTACSPNGTSADPEHQAFCGAIAKGVVFVVAAGNDTADADLTIPARYDEVITVSAIADYDGLPGRPWLTWLMQLDRRRTTGSPASPTMAPRWISPRPGYVSGRHPERSLAAHLIMSGTSMATPHVTAGVARYLARHESATPSAVRQGVIAEGSSAWLTATDPDTDP